MSPNPKFLQRFTSMPEEVYYYLIDGWYKGGEPAFYSKGSFDVAAKLEQHYPEISNEVLDYFSKHGSEIKANFTPYNYREQGWKTINLYSYFLKYKENCAKFPVLNRVAQSIPGMCLAQVAVLAPQTTIKAHIGDTDAIVRTHLGIKIPGTYPELALRIKNEERCWKEGEAFSFCIVNRHKAWNLTDEYRLIVMIDIIRPQWYSKRYKIASKTLAAITLKYIATRFPILKRTPKAVVRFCQNSVAWLFRLKLWFQQKVN